MKVILLQDVSKVGKKDAVVDVSDGYARNFLVARGLAEPLTDGAKKVLEKQQADRAAKQEELKEKALEVQKKLENIKLVFHEKVGSEGRMCSTISTKHVVETLRNQYDISVDKKKFEEKTPISAFGITKYHVELFKGVIGEITVQVLPKETK